MDRGNQSLVPEFILLGFSINPQIRIVLFVVFLLALLVTLATNSFIITIIRADSQLHTPMYFFLCNLSLLDICFLITNVPTCLKGFVSTKNSIAYSSCVAQVLVGLSLGIAQCVLLAVMAWDRYVAICKPFSYQHLMSRPMSISLAMATWASGILLSVAQTPFLLNVHFCGHHKINHVVCEMAAILHLSCTDIHIFQVVIFVISVVILVSPLSLIILTYVPIIFTIVRMPTSSSKHRACSTCGSHLMVVSLFYGTMIVMYVRPGSITSRDNEKVISVFYGLVTPALNPLIYTLRNKEVKQAVQRRLNRIKARAAV